MAILAGMKASAVDLALPAPVAAHGNGTNVITATAFTDLPTTGSAVSIMNPHPTANMLVDVRYGCWASATANAVRVCPRVSGSVTIAAGVGGGGPVGYGEIIRAVVEYQQYYAGFTVEIPPGTATVTLQAYRESATGTQNVNYPTVRVIPLRYVF